MTLACNKSFLTVTEESCSQGSFHIGSDSPGRALFLCLLLDFCVVPDAAQDQHRTQQRQGRRDLPEEEYRQNARTHRLQELAGGHKGRGLEFQGPGENGVA